MESTWAKGNFGAKMLFSLIFLFINTGVYAKIYYKHENLYAHSYLLDPEKEKENMCASVIEYVCVCVLAYSLYLHLCVSLVLH